MKFFIFARLFVLYALNVIVFGRRVFYAFFINKITLYHNLFRIRNHEFL